MATKIDQKEYLKRYLSNDKDAKKKKKKKDKLKAAKKANVVIVDDDLDLSALQSRIDDNETDLFGLDEEAPQVVGIIDERPPELRAKEDFSSAKWKALNANDGGFDTMIRANESKRADGNAEARVSFKAQGAKTERRRKYDSDESPPRQQKGSRSDRRGKDSDESPPRRRTSEERDVARGRNKRDDSDESPPRKSAMGKSRKRHDSDESPPRRGRSKEKEDKRRKHRDDDSDESPPRKTGTRNHQDSGESPPRRGRSKEKEGSRKKGKQDDTRERTRKNYDSDVSPPRRRRSKEKDDAKRKRRGDDSDESPRRKTGTREKNTKKHPDSDESPPRRKRSKEKDISRGKGRRDESDESPPRRKAATEKRNDTSPPRKRRQHDSDESPPRRREEKAPERRKQRHDSIESPPRRHRDKEHRERDKREVRHRSSDSDESPPRRKEYERKKSSNRRHDSEESPPRHSRAKEAESQTVTVKRERRHNDSDESPPRRSSRRSPERRQQKPSHGRTVSPPVRIKQERKSSDSDLSPPRKSSRPQERESPPRRNQLMEQRRIKQEPRSPSTSASRHAPAEKMAKTLDGKRAGLQDAKSLREENEQHRAREREALMKLSDEMSGRYAETVVREKGGRRRDVEKELREELAKRKHDEKKKEIYTRWGKGVKQVEDYRAQLEEAAREMEKPLARYADDKDLDEHLKQQEREGDPMLEYLRSKRREENKRAGIPEKPVYQGAFPDNRYGIRPGYRWDGVDRSNGFEKRWFETMSKKKAVEEEAYKYSVEDM